MALIKLKICANMLSFLKESSRLQILHIDGAEFYANNEGLKSFKGKSIASSQLRQLIKVLKMQS